MMFYVDSVLLVFVVSLNYIMNFCFSFWISLLKLAIVYGFYLGMVWGFDYVYMPILTIKFGYSMIFLLYPSLFLISLWGLWIYNVMAKSLQFDDIFFIGEISDWMKRKENGFWARMRNFLVRSDRLVFVVVSVWWSPFHAYLYRKYNNQIQKESFWEIIKNIAHGSIYCTLFWGGIADLVWAIWNLAKSYVL